MALFRRLKTPFVEDLPDGEAASPSGPRSAGDLLRQQREALRLDLDDVAAALRIKPDYLASLEAIGIDLSEHDIKFEEDNWESPTLGAWGIGWQVMLDGQEITQFTYFQQCGGIAFAPRQGMEYGSTIECDFNVDEGKRQSEFTSTGCRHGKQFLAE